MGKKKKEDDVLIDFSGVKNIDFKTVTKFFSKYAPLFLILIPLILSVHIRTLPSQMDITERWARDAIYNNIRNNIISPQINQQYPNLPVQSKESIITEQMNQFLVQNQAQIEEAILQQAEIFKNEFRTENGNILLGDIDSYYWLRYAENLVETGHIGDEIKDSVEYDNHMFAPIGLPVIQNIYPYIEAYLFKILSPVVPGLDLMTAAFLTPMVLSFFAIVAAFFIARKIAGNLAGFIAAMLIAVNSTILSRSLGSDNDIVNAVFPLLIMFFLFHAFDSKDYKKVSIFSALTGIILGLYSFAWSGWWFMFLFIIGASVSYIGYIFVLNWKRKKSLDFLDIEFRSSVLLLAVFLTFTFISLSLLGNGSQFLSSFTNPLNIIRIDNAAKGVGLWPNVYTTVAELNSASFSNIIANMGGVFFLFLAFIGTIIPLGSVKQPNKSQKIALVIYFIASAAYFLLFLALASNNLLNTVLLLALFPLPLAAGLLMSILFEYDIKPKHSILMAIWFIATIYAATKGVRFILLIVPVFAISFSMFIGFSVDALSRWINKNMDMDYKLTKVILVFIALTVLIQPITTGYNLAYNYVPNINAKWVDTLTKIRAESEPDAIVNSWWDFGHWFKYWTDRAVTFDGASQNKPQAHWIGKVLLTDDEDQAIAILRMLDCGATRAEESIHKVTGDSYDSISLLYEYLSMSPQDVRSDLLGRTDEAKADEIMSYLFCEPPENYFITSEDMVGKSGVWAHFGIWSFERAKIYNLYLDEDFNSFVLMLQEDLGYTEDQAKRTYYEINSLVTDRQVNDWIAPWPSYGGLVGCRDAGDEIIQCNIPNGNQNIPLLINLTSMDAYIQTTQGTVYPNNFAYVGEEGFTLKEYEGPSLLGHGVALLEDNSTLLISSEELTGSMFTRLFFFDGKGTEHFDKFYDVRDLTGSRIITWKVDWPESG